ncbi:hypothetical protein L596_011851 [Steinernema carpocapsae]|uniref:Uncharacterized protein n=1 Tax=Steinernema carpocapsae TaxID=34508 RepID=A0A4U5NVJ0_STECR|nr:hypothetical protein L596_011851 [Steinernema carpocapsae]
MLSSTRSSNQSRRLHVIWNGRNKVLRQSSNCDNLRRVVNRVSPRSVRPRRKPRVRDGSKADMHVASVGEFCSIERPRFVFPYQA